MLKTKKGVMMNEWKEVKLGEVAEIVGGGTPKTSISKYWNGDIPWLSVGDFNTGNKYVSNTEKTITALGLEKSSTRLLKKDDIIISARGTVGVLAMLDKPMTFNQSCYGIKAKENQTTNNYLFYFLRNAVRQLQQVSYGAVFDTITKNTLNAITILLPPLSEQKAIAEVLSCLDDKIDLLHRQNHTLEQMAQTLFTKWFVVKKKEEWEYSTFHKWILETVGGEWGKENKQGDFCKPVICIRGTDIADLNTGLANKAPIRYVKEVKFNKIEPKSGDIVIEISGGTEQQSTGRTTYINDEVKALFKHPLIFSNFSRLIRIKKQEYSYFLYSYLQHLYKKNEFFNLENGSSGIKNLDYKTLLFEYEYPMPLEKDVLNFHRRTSPLFQKINQNKQQIRTLSTLRDTLLPKLISGAVSLVELRKNQVVKGCGIKKYSIIVERGMRWKK